MGAADDDACNLCRQGADRRGFGRTVGHGAVQHHGGIGMTNEYVNSQFLRRIFATERSCSATSIITSGGSRTICRCHTDLVLTPPLSRYS